MKLEEIEYSFSNIVTESTTIGIQENYFLRFGMDLSSTHHPFANNKSHFFRLPITRAKYEEIQSYVKDGKKLSLVFNEGKLELIVDESKPNLSEQSSSLEKDLQEEAEYRRRAERDFRGLVEKGIKSIPEGNTPYNPEEDGILQTTDPETLL